VASARSWGAVSECGRLRQGPPAPRETPQRVNVAYTLYSAASVPARREMVSPLGTYCLGGDRRYLMTEGGFRSEHFGEARLRSLVAEGAVRPLTSIAYVVTF